jgi:hypothetical protein
MDAWMGMAMMSESKMRYLDDFPVGFRAEARSEDFSGSL